MNSVMPSGTQTSSPATSQARSRFIIRPLRRSPPGQAAAPPVEPAALSPPDFFSGLASDLLSGLASDFFSPSPPDFFSPSPLSARLRFLSWSDLRSVSYQPLPFRRKRGAEILRFSAVSPQSGQSVSGSSLIFCSASSSCPQLLHTYS